MTSTVTRVVDISVSRLAGIQSLAAFDIPAIITAETPNASFGVSNRAKKYLIGSLSSVGTDFGTSSETYKAARAIVSQRPTASSFYIIKRGAAVARVKTLTFSADMATGQTATVVVHGETVTQAWSTDWATTIDALATKIQNAIGVDTAVDTVASDLITVTFDAEFPGDISASVSGSGAPTVTIATTTAGRTIADDISDAIAESTTNKWYMLAPVQGSMGIALAAGAEIEARRKMMILQAAEAGIIDATETEDTLSLLNGKAYTRTALMYHSDTTEYGNAALAGRFLGVAPGQVSASLKTLAGVTADDLTDDQADAVIDKEGVIYIEQGNTGITLNGVLVNGDPIESTRDIDYFVNELEEEIYSRLVATNKLPADINGLAAVKGWGQGVVNRMVLEGVFAATDENGDAPEFTVPALADWDASDKAAGILSGCKVFAQLANSIVKVEVAANIALA